MGRGGGLGPDPIDGPSGILPFRLDTSFASSNTNPPSVTPEKMDIDVESILQQATELSYTSNADSNLAITNLTATTIGAQYDDADENDAKPSSRPVSDNIIHEIPTSKTAPGVPTGSDPAVSPNNTTIPASTTTSLTLPSDMLMGTGNIIGDPTPGIEARASPPGNTLAIPPTDNNNPPVAIPGAAHRTGTITNPYQQGRNNNNRKKPPGQSNPTNNRRKPSPGIPIISLYNLTVRPNKVTHEFQIENIIGNLLRAMQRVDRTASIILAHTDRSLPKLVNVSQLPSTDVEMDKYIEDPRTSSSGKFGKLSLRLTFETRIAFPIIKRDSTFAVFIRKDGLFFEKVNWRQHASSILGSLTRNYPTAHEFRSLQACYTNLSQLRSHFKFCQRLSKQVMIQTSSPMRIFLSLHPLTKHVSCKKCRNLTALIPNSTDGQNSKTTSRLQKLPERRL